MRIVRADEFHSGSGMVDLSVVAVEAGIGPLARYVDNARLACCAVDVVVGTRSLSDGSRCRVERGGGAVADLAPNSRNGKLE